MSEVHELICFACTSEGVHISDPYYPTKGKVGGGGVKDQTSNLEAHCTGAV